MGEFYVTNLSVESETGSGEVGFNSSNSSSELSADDNGGPNMHTITLALILSAFSTATVFGNALVILAVARERYLHSVTNYFITSLAVADCLVGLVVMPFQAFFELMGKKWIFGEAWCDLWHSLDVLASTSSILHLSVISLDRYWAITDPFTYPSRMTNRRAVFLIALVWASSSLISFPAILWWRLVRPPHTPLTLNCPFTNDLPYLVFSSLISFYGPLLLMLFTYWRIYRAAVEQTRSLKLGSKFITDGDVELTLRIHRGGGQSGGGDGLTRGQSTYGGRAARQGSSDDGESEIGPIALLGNNENGMQHGRGNSVRTGPKNVKNFSISRKLAKFAKEKKAAKTLGIVMGVFIVCCEAELVTDIATWLGWINSGMNPVIYACWSRDFRRAFGRILCACCPGRIRKQYRPGGLRPKLVRLTQSMTIAKSSVVVSHTRGRASCTSDYFTSTIPSRIQRKV